MSHLTLTTAIWSYLTSLPEWNTYTLSFTLTAGLLGFVIMYISQSIDTKYTLPSLYLCSLVGLWMGVYGRYWMLF